MASSVESFTAAYVSDEEISLSWACDLPVSILVSVDGSDAPVIVAEDAEGPTLAFESEQNRSYVFACVAQGEEDAVSSGVVCTSPAPPVSVAPTRSVSGSVDVTVDNSAQRHSAALEVSWRTGEDGDWSEPVDKAPATTELSLDPGAGEIWIRARNVIGALSSEWTVSAAAAADYSFSDMPSLLEPVDGSLVDIRDGKIAVSWRPNLQTAQREAQVRYRVDDGQWATVDVGAQSSCEIPIAKNNSRMTFMVRVRGAAAWSTWSQAASVNVRKSPSITLSVPSAVTSLPLVVGVSVDDESGVAAYADVRVSGDGVDVTKRAKDGSVTFSADELALASGKAYAVTAVVMSTSTLTASATATFSASFTAPVPPLLFATAGDGEIALVARPGAGEGAPTVSVAVFRENPDGSRTQVARGAAVDAVDRLPPLDCEVGYVATAYAGDGPQASTTTRVIVDSRGKCYFNWGDAFERRAACWRELQIEAGTENECETIAVTGRSLPMAFFGEHEESEPSSPPASHSPTSASASPGRTPRHGTPWRSTRASPACARPTATASSSSSSARSRSRTRTSATGSPTSTCRAGRSTMRWLESGRHDAFRYQRIAWPSFGYVGDVGGVEDASVTKNAGSSLKVSGSMRVCGETDFGNDLVRIVSESRLGDEVETVVHATLFATSPSEEHRNGAERADVSLYSTLVVLDKKRVRSSLRIPAGTNVLEWCAGLVRSLKLPCTYTPSGVCLSAERIYERDTSYLTVVNEMLDVANYASANVNGYGGVIMAPYQNPAAKAPARRLSDGWDNVLMPEFTVERDWFDVPNVVSLVCSNGDKSMVATAVFDDPGSFLSTANRYEVTYTEQVDDVASQAALNAKARSRLQDKLSHVERTRVVHPYLPESIGDVWELDYGNHETRGSIYEQVTRMRPGMRTETTVRKVIDVG